MKTEETKVVTTTLHETTVTETVCDVCKQPAPKPDGWRDDWTDINEVQMSYSTGYRVPEGGSKTTTLFDVCPTCWETKILPFMASFGAEPRIEESDW